MASVSLVAVVCSVEEDENKEPRELALHATGRGMAAL